MPEDTRPPRRWKSAAHRFFFDGDDTIAALILALLALGTLVAFLIALHSKNARGDVLKISGGLLVVFSAYSASRTLALNRLDQRTGRILQATEQLRSDSATVRSGGLWTLVELAISSKSPHERRQRNVIDEVLLTANRDATMKIDDIELERARRIISAGRLHSQTGALRRLLVSVGSRQLARRGRVVATGSGK